MTAPAEPTRTVEEWVYVGRRIGQTTPELQVFNALRDGEPDGASRCWKKLIKAAIIGGVYRVTSEKDADGKLSVFVSGKDAPVWLRVYGDADKVAQWRAEDAATGAIAQRAKVQARAKRNDALAAALKPVRDAYLSNPLPDARRALLVLVLEYVQTGRGMD